MHAASREAIETVRASLKSALASVSGDDVKTVGTDLFSVAGHLDEQRALRQALVDSSASTEDRQDLVRSVFGYKVSETAMSVLTDAVSQDWSNPRDMRESLISLGREALFTSAEKDGTLTQVENELFAVSRVVANNAELEQALHNPSVTGEVKQELLGSLINGKVSDVTGSLASQVIGRPEGLPADGIESLSQAAAAYRGERVAVVTAANPLTDAQREQLVAKLSARYGSDISLHEDIDSSILGGLVVRVGDDVIDGSVSGKIEKVRTSIR